MIYLPDTNAWIRLLNPGENRVKERFLVVPAEQIRLCSVVKAELYFGAMKSGQREKNLALLNDLFSAFPSFGFDDEAAKRYGHIRSELVRCGTPIGPNDLMIAATAAAHGAVVVTHNVREFCRIPDLAVEDWEEP